MEISAYDESSADSPAFVMSYFTLADEALHLAISYDGIRFAPVFGGAPLLRSDEGARSIRDPFIGEDADGLFHLLGTDGWRSTSIVHSTSDDLVHWARPKLLPVMATVEGTYNAWAPEFFTDPATGIHHLIWSSIVDPSTRPPEGAWVDPQMRQRIWTSRTTDFIRFTPPEVFFDPGYTVIDATVVRDGGGFLMAYKDERGRNALDTDNKTIRFARFAHPGAPFEHLDASVPFSPVEGPSLFRRGDDWVVIFDRFLEDSYAAATSPDAIRWSPAPLEVPAGMRHASVFTPSHPLNLPTTQPAVGMQAQSPTQG